MSKRWQIVFCALILVVSLPGSAIAAGPPGSPQSAAESHSPDITVSPEPPDPQPTRHSPAFVVAPTAGGDTLPWRQNRLPAFVGDSASFQIEPSEGYELINASWQTTGPAMVTPTVKNGSTARTKFDTQGETTLQITATLRNIETNKTVERTSPQYTLIAVSEQLTIDEFSVRFAESPDRWEEAAVYAHLRGLSDLHRNLTQRLPLPSSVDLEYTTEEAISARCGSYAYACVYASSSGDSTMYMPYDVGNYTLSQRATIYRHELTHVAQFHGMDMAYEGNWNFIVEGHAEYEESDRFYQRTLAEKPSKQDLLEFTGSDYDQSELFVSAFVAQYGYQPLRQLIGLSRYNSVGRAFQRVTGESFDSFYDRWEPTNESSGPNAVRTNTPTSPKSDTIHQKPRFVYDNRNLTALGFNRYASGDGVTISWDTDTDGESEFSGRAVKWTPSEAGDHTVTVRYTNGNASLSRTQTIAVSDVPLTPNDVDDDGLYEDVNGNGAATITDVQALFANQDKPYVQNNPQQFDFNGDGQFNVLDVQALFQAIAI